MISSHKNHCTFLATSMYTDQCRSNSRADYKLYNLGFVSKWMNHKSNCDGSRRRRWKQGAARLVSVGCSDALCSSADCQWSWISLNKFWSRVSLGQFKNVQTCLILSHGLDWTSIPVWTEPKLQTWNLPQTEITYFHWTVVQWKQVISVRIKMNHCSVLV